MAKLVDAPDLGSGGKPWGFESLYPHQTKQAEKLVFLCKDKNRRLSERREQGLERVR